MAEKFAQIVTDEGIAVYPKLRTTEVFDGEDTGKYACSIKLSEAGTNKLLARIEKEWEDAKASSAFEGKRYSKQSMPALGYHENKDGEIIFKAKTNAVIRTKAGEVIEKSLPVFDATGKPYAADVEVGNGSTIRLCLLLRPFYASATVYGIQLLLKAVQVLKYVEPSASSLSASDCGFDCMGMAAEDSGTDFPPSDIDADF